MKDFACHVYFALRYGSWDWGWENYEKKPMFGVYHTWYDGYHTTFHLYKLWINVHY